MGSCFGSPFHASASSAGPLRGMVARTPWVCGAPREVDPAAQARSAERYVGQAEPGNYIRVILDSCGAQTHSDRDLVQSRCSRRTSAAIALREHRTAQTFRSDYICVILHRMRSADGFSAEVARRAVGITYRQLDYWDKTGLVRPSVKQARGKGSRRVYAFEDLVELRVIAQLLGIGVSLVTVRRAARYVRQHFADLIRPLARLTLAVQGKRILVRTTDGKALVDATSGGQVVISFSVAPIAEDLRGKVTELRSPRRIAVRVGGRSFVAVLTPDLAAGGYSIEVPELPGVITEADSLPEARRTTADAIRLWLTVADAPVQRRAR